MVATLKWAVALVLTGATAVGAQIQLDKAPPPVVDVNMLFVPPAELTKRAATGYENLIADGLWLGLLQYYGDRLAIDQGKKVVNLAAMFDLITDLDPQFWFAYWLGAWAIGDSGEPDAAVKLLQKGARLNPGDYNYPYLEGYVRFLFQRDYAGAAASFERAAALAARKHQKTGNDDLALRTWQTLYQNATDNTTRRIAKNNVERILAEMQGAQERAWKINQAGD